jgi:hypothetical protein
MVEGDMGMRGRILVGDFFGLGRRWLGGGGLL